jgi:hypothetical protein
VLNDKYATLFQDDDYAGYVASRILSDGYVELPDFFDDETFQVLLTFGKGLGFDDKGVNRRQGTDAMNVARSAAVMDVINAVYKALCRIDGKPYKSLSPEQQVVGFPVRRASDGNTSENPFHFDASHINGVLGLSISTDAREGNLQIYPNLRRRIKPRILATVCARLLRHYPLLRRVFKPKEVVYRERAMYFFLGDVTFHGVTSITQGERLVMVFNSSSYTPSPEKARMQGVVATEYGAHH